ncbi:MULTISPECIES: TonB-dependent receptor [unclassified Sulfuricurvum]|uniref:TonB-dependent receptor n=1 Tax=unclassified Sulfuricurvum TaxID=2632390 RepID=UPI000299692E|nr:MULTISPECIES: TonB-dependent receptor [unclassified Sulfuricurvum]AFV98368.1 tonb-dependent receptor [Candidatus Sulfuricurvum sp. RIFRC-1]HBM36557.1 TonB-dependent receptor [Sulfuricurvum sp.]
MKKFTILSLTAVAALASEPITIQKITVEASAPKGDTKAINADEIVKFSRQSDLGEMLSGALPEITHVRTTSIGNDIVLRGFKKDNLNVTIDDAKICGACPNRMDPPAMHISSSQIANVEVQEGPFDVTQFGSLGGAINVVTKDPEKGLHGEISATLGSYDYRKISTTVEGGNDAIQALVGYSRETSGQYKDGDSKTMAEQADGAPANQRYSTAHKNDDAYARQNFWAKIVGNIGENQKLTLNYFGDRADDVLYARYPMDALKDDTDMFKAAYQLFSLGAFSEELLIEAYHSKVKHEMGTDFRASATSAAATMVSPVDATIQGIRVENSASLNETEVILGIDLSKRNWNGTKGSRLNPYAQIQIPDADTDNIGLYAKASQSFDAWDLSGGLRYDDTHIDADQNLMATAKDRDYDNISANVLGRYHYSSNGNLFIGIGQTSRVPDARELYFASVGNTNLNETINREIDMGVEHTFGNLHLKGTVFYSDLKDYIYAYKVVGSTTSFANIDARIVGGDVTADYILNKEWSIESGMAYQRGTKENVNQLDSLATLPQTDKDLADIPPLKGRIALVFDDAKNYAEAEFIAAKHQTYDENNGEQAIAGYGVLNLKYGTELGNGFSVSAGINNFFDRTYAVSNSYIGLTTIMEGAQPLVLNEPGRNFYATVAYKF